MIDNSPKRPLQVRLVPDRRLIPLLIGHLLVCGKAGWENLIQDLVLSPCRQLKQLLLPKILRAVIHLLNIRDTFVIKIMIAIIRNLTCCVFNLKKVPQTNQINRDHTLEIVDIIVRTGKRHLLLLSCIHHFQRQILVLCMKDNPRHIALFRLKPNQKASFLHRIAISLVRKMSDCRIFHSFSSLCSIQPIKTCQILLQSLISIPCGHCLFGSSHD